MGRKMVVTETVVAELVPGPPPPTTPPPAPPPPPASGRGRAARGAAPEVDANVQVLGVVPGVSLAEQMIALTSSLGFAAHNATSFQANHAIVLGASTVMAVATLLGTTPAPACSRIASPPAELHAGVEAARARLRSTCWRN